MFCQRTLLSLWAFFLRVFFFFGNFGEGPIPMEEHSLSLVESKVGPVLDGGLVDAFEAVDLLTCSMEMPLKSITLMRVRAVLHLLGSVKPFVKISARMVPESSYTSSYSAVFLNVWWREPMFIPKLRGRVFIVGFRPVCKLG